MIAAAHQTTITILVHGFGFFFSYAAAATATAMAAAAETAAMSLAEIMTAAVGLLSFFSCHAAAATAIASFNLPASGFFPDAFFKKTVSDDLETERM